MSIPDEEVPSFVSLRLRRVTFEYAYINVPGVDIVAKPDEQGVIRIDGGELTRKAIEMSQSPEVVWYREQEIIEMHPLQNERNVGEDRFNRWAYPVPPDPSQDNGLQPQNALDDPNHRVS
jgi:hypothetical protein